MTSGRDRSSSSSVGDPPRADFEGADAETGTEIGSLEDEDMSAAPAATQTRPLASPVMAVISGLEES